MTTKRKNKNLLAQCIARGLSVTALATRIGRSRTDVYRAWNGHRYSRRTLELIKGVLNENL
jgi:hypothetical protein